MTDASPAPSTGRESGLPATLQDAVDILVERHESARAAYEHLLGKFKRGEDIDVTLAAMSDMKQRYPEVQADE